jgi:RNA polymerase sigma factor (sigma-70 family)
MPQSTTAHPGIPFNWLEKVKANDETTLKAIYAANYPKIENYITRNSGSVDDARDIFQEAFLATWRNIQLDRFEPKDEGSLAGYIFRIAQHKWMDQLRSNKRRKTVALPPMEIADTDIDMASKEETDYIEKVKAHYAALGDQCRELLKRFYFLKESMREIAAFFSWTEATAKNNKYRCLERLRILVTKSQ